MALLVPIITFVVVNCVIWLQFYQEITGKGDDPFKSIRQNFEKKHPGLNRKIDIAFALFVSALMVFIFRMYILDFVYCDMQVTRGEVIRIEHAKIPVFKTIYLDSNKSYLNWFGGADIEKYGYYEIYYTPRSETIVKTVKLQ